MNGFIRLSLLTLLLGGCTRVAFTPDISVKQETKVEQQANFKVNDGDTVYINEVEWRFRCIDAPETYKNESNPGQPLGQDATEYLEKVILNEGIVIKEVSPQQSYGRSLGVPYTNSNKNISIMLLEKGYAVIEPRYTDCENMDRYYEAQEYAQQNSLGVWGLENMVTPWDYRHSR